LLDSPFDGFYIHLYNRTNSPLPANKSVVCKIENSVFLLRFTIAVLSYFPFTADKGIQGFRHVLQNRYFAGTSLQINGTALSPRDDCCHRFCLHFFFFFFALALHACNLT
jgi:hypothetical protein